MGSGQSKPIDNRPVYLAQNECSLYKHNKFLSAERMPFRVRQGLQTSSKSDTSPNCNDESPPILNTIFRKSYAGNKKRGYNSLKEPVNRKYPWRVGNENDTCMSLLPKPLSLKPWGPIKNYYQTDASSEQGKNVLNVRDVQSRFCREIHERYASMGETDKRRRLEAIQALEKRLQDKSGFTAQVSANKSGSLRTPDLKSQRSSEGSIMGVPKTTNKTVINSEIHAWRMEHLSNFERRRESTINKAIKPKVISDRMNEVVSNAEVNVKDKVVDLSNVANEKTEATARESRPRLNFKMSSATYINKIYTNPRFNTFVPIGRNYCKMRGRFGKDIVYPRQTNKAVFLLLKTFANRSPSPVKPRHAESGRGLAPLCDKSTSMSMENFRFSYRSVETQTAPVHISRKIELDSTVLSQLDRVPKLEVNHRGSLTKHVSRTPSRTFSSTQQVVLGYSQGVTIDTCDRYGRRDNFRRTDTISDTRSINKLAGRSIVADNIHQIIVKESIDGRPNARLNTRRDNFRQTDTIIEKDAIDAWSANNKLSSRRISAANSDLEPHADRPNNVKFNTRRDYIPQTATISEKGAMNTWSINKKLAARRIAAENIHRKIGNSYDGQIEYGPNNAKFTRRRMASDNCPQKVISHEKELTEEQSTNDRYPTRVVPNNTVREKPQNGPFSAEFHNYLCYRSREHNHIECSSRSVHNGNDYEKQRYVDERDRISEHTGGEPKTAKTCAYQRTDAAKEEYNRSQQNRCRIPVPKTQRNDRPSIGKRVVQMEEDAETNKDKVQMDSEDYKNLCKLRLDLVNGGGDINVPSVRRESTGSPDEDNEDVDRLLCGRRKVCRHWGKRSAPRCGVCLERICYDIKEDEEDSESSQRMS